VVLPEGSGYLTVEISQRLGGWEVLEPFVVAITVINVPVGTHHGAAGVACGRKSGIGITGKARIMCRDDLDRAIAEGMGFGRVDYGSLAPVELVTG
jgi:hypothetical protein